MYTRPKKVQDGIDTLQRIHTMMGDEVASSNVVYHKIWNTTTKLLKSPLIQNLASMCEQNMILDYIMKTLMPQFQKSVAEPNYVNDLLNKVTTAKYNKYTKECDDMFSELIETSKKCQHRDTADNSLRTVAQHFYDTLADDDCKENFRLMYFTNKTFRKGMRIMKVRLCRMFENHKTFASRELPEEVSSIF